VVKEKIVLFAVSGIHPHNLGKDTISYGNKQHFSENFSAFVNYLTQLRDIPNFFVYLLLNSQTNSYTMKNHIFKSLTLGILLLIYHTTIAAPNGVTPEDRVPLADPFIMLHGNTYYAYGTHHRNGIEVYTSKNLKEWHFGGLALHKNNSYGEKWFWAPEVYHIDGKFYMYYTAEKRICVATSNSPTGPFKQVKQEPMHPGKHVIDNTLFIDDDGTPYLLYVVINRGFSIYISELEKDYMTIKPGTETFCIRPKQRWEREEGKVNEGPSIIKHKGTYFLLYSGNGYTSQKYGIGCATSTSIRGPWKKSPNNPILQSPRSLAGSGHGAPFYDKKGRLHYLFHAHYSNEKIHPRCMYISRAAIKYIEGKEQFVISDRYRTPRRVR